MKNTFFLYDLLLRSNIYFDKKSLKNIEINNACDLLSAAKGSITYCSNIKYLDLLSKTKASVILISKSFLKNVPKKKTIIISEQPDLDFLKVLNVMYPHSYFSKINYDNLSRSSIKKKYKDLQFGLNFYLEKDVKIGKKVMIGNNVTIKTKSIIGNNVIIGSNVLIENAKIFDNVHICDGAIIGKKGFGFKFINNECIRVPHLGNVIIEEGCEIGANCVIDRGSIKNTIIGKNTFLDNMVHIAHNVKIGSRCIIAAQTGIAGSSIIGDNVTIGGQSGISGHLTIGKNVKIGGKSGVIRNIEDNQIVMGYPAKSIRSFMKDNKCQKF